MNSKRMMMAVAAVGLSAGLLAPQAMAQAAGDIERGADNSTETQSDIEDSPQMPGVRTPTDDVNNGTTVGGEPLRDDDTPDVVNEPGDQGGDTDNEDESPD